MTIQQEASITGPDGAHAEITLDPIAIAASVVDEPDSQVVEDGRVGAPGLDIRNGQGTAPRAPGEVADPPPPPPAAGGCARRPRPELMCPRRSRACRPPASATDGET